MVEVRWGLRMGEVEVSCMVQSGDSEVISTQVSPSEESYVVYVGFKGWVSTSVTVVEASWLVSGPMAVVRSSMVVPFNISQVSVRERIRTLGLMGLEREIVAIERPMRSVDNMMLNWFVVVLTRSLTLVVY